MRLAIVLGTIQEIIKLATIIRIFEREQEDYFILHTGQNILRVAQVTRQNTPLRRLWNSCETGKVMRIGKVFTRGKPYIVLI